MRLINTTTLELEDFTLREIPQYAILSHTWGQDEVTFQDMNGKDLPRYFKQGYVKIVETCRLASEHDLKYAWIDTCCIDKTSSAELTEAINSMFHYYGQSTVCIAHLADLEAGTNNISSCRWFTRGWTLQELLTPTIVEFYNQEWEYIGSKTDHMEAIAKATNIGYGVLKDPSRIREYPLATRLSWSSRRQTTRPEDIAYCLLGIFDVNMPLIYGEGEKAFERLVWEVVRQENDLTILAWMPPQTNVHAGSGTAIHGMHLLPQHPSVFHQSDDISQLPGHFPELTITNRGLRVSPDVALRTLSRTHHQPGQFVGICVGSELRGAPLASKRVYLPLRKIGPGLFCRHNQLRLTTTESSTIERSLIENTINYYIVIYNIEKSRSSFSSYRKNALFIPKSHDFDLIDAVPERLWDPEDRAFLRPDPQSRNFFPMALAMIFQARNSSSSPIMVLCDNSTGVPSAGFVSDRSAHIVMRELFRGRQREESLIWADFEALGVEVRFMSNENVSRDEAGHDLVLKQGTSEVGSRVQISLHSRGAERLH